MSSRIFLTSCIGLLFIVLFSSCSSSEYADLIKREMATGVVHDSLLFEMKFGIHQQDFYQKCWQLNQKGIISNGPGNKTVKYVLPTKAESRQDGTGITMLFFGDFNEQKIMTGMDFEFYYNAWSIWNKKLQSDQLVPVIQDSLKKWYPGNDFIKVKSEKDSTEILVKVDGNRRIVIKPIHDPRTVKAKIDDLRYVLQKD